MSKTYRRKGKEPDWLLDDPEWIMRFWHRNPAQQKARYHSDAWDTGPNCRKWGKRFWAKMRRNWDRQEFSHLAKSQDYEPIWFTTKIDTWWWD